MYFFRIIFLVFFVFLTSSFPSFSSWREGLDISGADSAELLKSQNPSRLERRKNTLEQALEQMDKLLKLRDFDENLLESHQSKPENIDFKKLDAASSSTQILGFYSDDKKERDYVYESHIRFTLVETIKSICDITYYFPSVFRALGEPINYKDPLIDVAFREFFKQKTPLENLRNTFQIFYDQLGKGEDLKLTNKNELAPWLDLGRFLYSQACLKYIHKNFGSDFIQNIDTNGNYFGRLSLLRILQIQGEFFKSFSPYALSLAPELPAASIMKNVRDSLSHLSQKKLGTIKTLDNQVFDPLQKDLVVLSKNLDTLQSALSSTQASMKPEDFWVAIKSSPSSHPSSSSPSNWKGMKGLLEGINKKNTLLNKKTSGLGNDLEKKINSIKSFFKSSSKNRDEKVFLDDLEKKLEKSLEEEEIKKAKEIYAKFKELEEKIKKENEKDKKDALIFQKENLIKEAVKYFVFSDNDEKWKDYLLDQLASQLKKENFKLTYGKSISKNFSEFLENVKKKKNIQDLQENLDVSYDWGQDATPMEKCFHKLASLEGLDSTQGKKDFRQKKLKHFGTLIQSFKDLFKITETVETVLEGKVFEETNSQKSRIINSILEKLSDPNLKKELRKELNDFWDQVNENKVEISKLRTQRENLIESWAKKLANYSDLKEDLEDLKNESREEIRKKYWFNWKKDQIINLPRLDISFAVEPLSQKLKNDKSTFLTGEFLIGNLYENFSEILDFPDLKKLEKFVQIRNFYFHPDPFERKEFILGNDLKEHQGTIYVNNPEAQLAQEMLILTVNIHFLLKIIGEALD